MQYKCMAHGVVVIGGIVHSTIAHHMVLSKCSDHFLTQLSRSNFKCTHHSAYIYSIVVYVWNTQLLNETRENFSEYSLLDFIALAVFSIP